jgi:hypothetical protein
MPHLLVRRLLSWTAGLTLVVGPCLASATDENVIAAWVQYTVGSVEVRAVARHRCPTLLVDGGGVGMFERAQPTQSHPNLVCAAEIPHGASSIRLDGRSLPPPVAKRPMRIVVMGDTGCRLSDSHGLYQECNNDSLWPFANVARSVGAYGPDLIVYTGDYIYRESPCPVGDNGCAGSPHGDTQETWEADWLLPARPVHAAAPLILIRGNHETCSRAGGGWFRYLDARPYLGECEDSTEPWVAGFDSMEVAVMDVANLEDEDGNPLTDLFASQLEWLAERLTQSSWIAAHRTFWGYGADDDTGELTTPTEELQDAVREAGLPEAVELLVGAHIHLAEVLDFGPERPPQLVVANSGTQLVARVEPPAEIDGIAIQSQRVIYQYGFVAMTALGRGGWSISFRDVDGREIERCRLHGKRVRCDDSHAGGRDR